MPRSSPRPLLRRLRAVGATLLGLLATLDVHADTQRAAQPVASTPRPAPAPCAIAPSREPRASADEVRALYEQFECHFAREEYSECLPYIERACRLTSSPRCLLNQGLVHHALMHCSVARDHYQAFLDLVPYDDARDDAREALRELEAACPSSPAAAAAVATPAAIWSDDVLRPVQAAAGSAGDDAAPPVAIGRPRELEATPPRASAPRMPGLDRSGLAVKGVDSIDLGHAASARRTLAWSLLGAGTAAAVSTLVLGSYGMRSESDFDARNRSNGALSLADDSELRAIDRHGRSYNRLMLGFGVASGLMLGAGATLLWIDLGPHAGVSVSAGTGARIDWRRSF